MYPEVLEEHIIKCKAATSMPFAVNLPLLYPDINLHIATIIKHKVPIVFTSAGSPKTWTGILQKEGIKVVHVVSSTAFALKSEAAGVDAIVAEGFEAGGHNGRDETTTLCLIPAVVDAVKIPVIAAGGIHDGRTMLAAMVLGADGVQIGTKYIGTPEASSHLNFKKAVLEAKEGATQLSLKLLTPVRLLKNEFYEKVKNAEEKGATKSELEEILGRARAKLGMFEGDLTEGELEIGQASAFVKELIPAGKLTQQIWEDFVNRAIKQWL
jgi:enoyl-[acyl-carrier protein] reductase II